MRYQYGITGVGGLLRANCRDGRFPRANCFWNEDFDDGSDGQDHLLRFALLMASWPATVHAQDVPGIEICTVEKTMERRTSCLQSNVDFLQKTINKLTSDHQQKIDAANRQIEALKGAVIGLQKLVSDTGGAEQGGGRCQEAARTCRERCSACGKDAVPAKGRREVAAIRVTIPVLLHDGLVRLVTEPGPCGTSTSPLGIDIDAAAPQACGALHVEHLDEVASSRSDISCSVASKPGPKYGECGASLTPISSASAATSDIR
jgi:hypothetical protein